MSRKGENIFKRKDGRWEARYIHHYENGKARYRYLYGTTYAEAKAKKIAEQAMLESAKIPAVKRLASFEELAGLWLADIKISIKESTYTRYSRIVSSYLLPAFQNQMLSKIDQHYLNGLSERLINKGGSGGTPLSAKTVSDILCILKAILKYGGANGYSCPDISGLRYPKRNHKSISVLSEKNRIRLEQISLNSKDTTSLGILFTLFTGVRIGELCGIRWADIDFCNSTVTICRTVERIADLDPFSQKKTKVIIDEPKTESSVRVIPLPGFLTEHLIKYKCDHNCYLLTGTTHPTEPHQYYVRYQRFLKRNHIEKHPFHTLRHTFATRCVEMGFDTKSLSEILGHNSVTTTLAVYVHPSLQQKKEQMERLTPLCLSQSV